MKRLHPMRILLFSFLIGALLTCTPAMERQFSPTPGIKIIPKPTTLTVQDGSFVFDKNTRVEIAGEYTELMPVASALGELFRKSAGFNLSFTPENEASKGGIVKLEIDRLLPELGAEGYKLTVSPDLISLKAYQPAGGVESEVDRFLGRRRVGFTSCLCLRPFFLPIASVQKENP